MKSLSDFTRPEDKSVPHLITEKEGSDDKEYINLMGQYKRARKVLEDHRESNKYLHKAMKLGRNGKVSKDAKILGAYL